MIRPTTRLLSADDPPRIVEDACRVLETIGVRVESTDAAALLAEAGATPSRDRWRIPERAVRAALATAPERVRVYDRDGDLALDLGGDRVHFDPGSAAIHVLEPGGGRHEATSDDVIALTCLVDGLDGYAAQSTSIVPADVAAGIADRHRLYLALSHGRKPVITGTFRADGFAPMHAMLAAVRGGADALAERPLAIFDCCPTAPLEWSDLTSRALIDCAGHGVPAELVSMPLTGATAPVTLREAVVQHCAENLSGVVIHQQAAPGAPIVYGGCPAAFDMRKGTTPMGAMETLMIEVAYAQVGKHLGLPTHAYMGLSDAKVPDYQAGFETGMGAVLGALAGINLISGPGMLDYLMCQSLEKLVLDHEVVKAALRLTRGMDHHTTDVLALFADLARTGTLLSHDHTRAHHRAELSRPSKLVDRDTWGDWEAAGARWAHDRAAADVQQRLSAADVPPLEPAIAATLDEIMRAQAR